MAFSEYMNLNFVCKVSFCFDITKSAEFPESHNLEMDNKAVAISYDTSKSLFSDFFSLFLGQ